MDLKSATLNVAETVFCKSNGHSESWELRVIVSLLVVILALPFMMLNIWKFSKKIQLFPLKARAPRLALVQMIYLVLLNLIPLCVEGLVAIDIHWDQPDKKYISRSILKALYFLIRSSVMLLYVQRTLLVYANWKVPLEQLYNLFWRIFGNETRSIMVSINHQAFASIQVLLLIVFTAASDNIVTGFSSLDIYKPSKKDWYLFFNPTFVEMVEGLALLLCFYCLR